MKKFKSVLFLSVLVICLSFIGGCAIYPSVTINNWNFVPQQASGTEIDLSLIAGSELEFDFTVHNQDEARDLLASTFSVVFTKNQSETNALSIYFDNHQTSLSFASFESRNLKLHVISTATVSSSTKITINYDGSTIIEYLVK